MNTIMFGKHHSNLLRCFRKILIDHRPDHTINRISEHIQNVFCYSNSLSRDNNLSKKIFDQIDFIMLFNGPDELFFRIKKLNQSLLQHFPIIRRNGIYFTIERCRTSSRFATLFFLIHHLTLWQRITAYTFLAYVQLLPYHKLGTGTFKKLGRPYLLEDVQFPTAEHMEHCRSIVRQYVPKVL